MFYIGGKIFQSLHVVLDKFVTETNGSVLPRLWVIHALLCKISLLNFNGL